MAAQIKFGTSGWRAVMAEEFTFANVQRAVHGIARYVSSQKSNRQPFVPKWLNATLVTAIDTDTRSSSVRANSIIDGGAITFSQSPSAMTPTLLVFRT